MSRMPGWDTSVLFHTRFLPELVPREVLVQAFRTECCIHDVLGKRRDWEKKGESEVKTVPAITWKVISYLTTVLAVAQTYLLEKVFANLCGSRKNKQTKSK